MRRRYGRRLAVRQGVPSHGLANGDNRLDFDGDVVRQGANANRQARMATRVAEYRDEEIRGAVDHLGLAGELGDGIDEPGNADAPLDAVEVAIQRGMHVRDEIQGADPSGPSSVLDAEIAAELSYVPALAVPLGDLPSKE